MGFETVIIREDGTIKPTGRVVEEARDVIGLVWIGNWSGRSLQCSACCSHYLLHVGLGAEKS